MMDITTVGTLVFLLFVALFVEKIYVSKIGIIPNLFIIVPLFIKNWSLTPDIFRYWLIVGIILGVIGVISYWKGFSMGFLHEINYLLYSLKTILGLYVSIILLEFSTISLIIGICISIYFWYVGIRYLDHKIPFGG